MQVSKYEFDGEKYKLASKHQKEWGNQLISQITIKGNEDILDLGCGDGVLTEQLAALVVDGNVTGIDASVGMIETAKKCEKSNLSFTCLNIDDLDYENSFDIIFSNAALHWVKDHQRLLANSIKALKTNGILAWNFAAECTCSNFYDTMDIVMNMPMYKEYFIDYDCPWYMPSKDNYISLIEKAGFKQYQVSYEIVDRYFANADEMTQWIDQPSIVPYLTYLPNDRKESFRNEVVAIMIEKAKQPDGRCFETFRRLNIKAIK